MSKIIFKLWNCKTVAVTEIMSEGINEVNEGSGRKKVNLIFWFTFTLAFDGFYFLRPLFWFSFLCWWFSYARDSTNLEHKRERRPGERNTEHCATKRSNQNQHGVRANGKGDKRRNKNKRSSSYLSSPVVIGTEYQKFIHLFRWVLWYMNYGHHVFCGNLSASVCLFVAVHQLLISCSFL